jgi:hypothetical protein
MVIGLLPDAAAAETLLNNLAEAEFNLADVSVLMRDAQQRAAIADDAGPLKGTDWRELADLQFSRRGIAGGLQYRDDYFHTAAGRAWHRAADQNLGLCSS